MIVRSPLVLSFLFTVSHASQSVADTTTSCSEQQNDLTSDQCNLLQMDYRSLQNSQRSKRTATPLNVWDQQVSRQEGWVPESVSSAHRSPNPLPSEDAVQTTLASRLGSAASQLLSKYDLEGQTQVIPDSEPIEASTNLGERELSSMSLTQASAQADAGQTLEAEEESALSAEVQLKTALKRVERGLHVAEAVEVKDAAEQQAVAQSLVESAEQVRASQKSAENQIAYTSRMSEFLEDAAQQAQDAHLIEERLAAKEEKASHFLENALQEVLVASSSTEGAHNNKALVQALKDALKAQAEVVAGATQQEQATSNLNTALHSAANAAIASDALSKLQISPSLENISKKIEFLQSSVLQQSSAKTEVAQYMEGAAEDAVVAESAANRVARSWQGVKSAQHRRVQEMTETQHTMLEESKKAAEEGRHVAHLLQQANEKMQEDHKRAEDELQLAVAEKTQAANMLKAAKQSEALTEKQAQENIQMIAKAKVQVVQAEQSLRSQILANDVSSFDSASFAG